uniref:Uncharacterized protein n=1 Tax=Arundo donax TaxID=35708 RepID=A0A0A9CC20_ARUDO
MTEGFFSTHRVADLITRQILFMNLFMNKNSTMRKKFINKAALAKVNWLFHGYLARD